MGKTRFLCTTWKDSISYLSPCVVDWRIILKGKNEPNMKVLRESTSHLTHGDRNEETRPKSSFCSANLEQAVNWISPSKGAIWKEDLVSKDWRRRYQVNFETKDFLHCQEKRCARPHSDTSDLE